MPSRWRWPPENSCANLRIASGRRPTRSNSAATRSSRSLPRAMPKFSSGSPTIVPADRRGFIDEYGSWKIVWMRLRCGHIAPGFSAVMSSPPSTMRPAVGSISLRMVLPTVDLPQPDSPTRPSVSPLAMVKLTPSTALTAPTRRCSSPPWIGKCFTSLSTSSDAHRPVSQQATVCPPPASTTGGAVGAAAVGRKLAARGEGAADDRAA